MSEQVNLTVAAPIALVPDAAQLARCAGYSADDELTFSGPDWKDEAGNIYRVTSGPVWPAFLDIPTKSLTEPEWGADLVAAGRALSLLNVIKQGDEVPLAIPAHIVAVIGLDGIAATQMLGLTPIFLEI
jgi:hypothetical protein